MKLRSNQLFGCPRLRGELLTLRSFARAYAIVLFALLLLACQPELQLPPPVIRPVICMPVMGRGGARLRIFTGSAKAGMKSRISFRVSGTLQELTPKVGDRVHTGLVLARLDPRDFELRVEEAEASLAKAQAQAVNAQASFERARKLFERDNVSQADYDAARATENSAQAQVSSARKRLETAKLQLSYTTLRSPIDGAVAEVQVEVNENIRQGQPITILNSGARPEVEVAIPEILISEVQSGARVRVTFDAIPEQEYFGRVTEVAVTAAEGLTTYPVTVSIDRQDRRILPGMAAEVTFEFGSGDNRVRFVLPPHAVVEDRQGRFVFVATPRGDGLGTVERRTVVVGEMVREGLEVLQGLQDGELVVVAGVSRIEDGQEVKLSEEPFG